MAISPAFSPRLTSGEFRATVALASVFALRMLGLFMILPVFAVFAKTIPGGDDTRLVGYALGAYGFTQSLFYIFYGWASDRLGRKPVIAVGLLIFAAGSAVAALAPNLGWMIAGRALQGAGAVSSAVIALLADLTHEDRRTQAMAIVGGSIGVSFAVAIVAAPILFRLIGMSGLFWAIGALALVAISIVLWAVPTPSAPPAHLKTPFAAVLRHPELLRLNFGVLVLHATQTALFVVLPNMLVTAGLPVASHWRVYLPVIGISFMLMVPAIIVAERRNQLKPVCLLAIVLILFSQLGLAEFPHTLFIVTAALFIYFAGFNVLEATQPSLVSKLAPGTRKGAAMGIYHTTQSFGYALGAVTGGWLAHARGPNTVFISASALMLAWLIIAASMRPPGRATVSADSTGERHGIG